MSGTPILPGATIGVVGGGQLGRMLAMAARRMAYRVIVLDPGENAPAAQLADAQIRAPLDDADAYRHLAEQSDVITLEWENASSEILRPLQELTPIRPGPHVLQVAQHRLREKDEARRLGLPTAEYRTVRSRADLQAAIAAIGTPAVLKTCEGGYDGKGQVVIRDAAEAPDAFEELGSGSQELILEGWVDFRMEASVICARNEAGEVVCFPVSENIHRDGILDLTVAPARISPALARQAQEIGEAMVEGLDLVGILAVELFIDHEDRLYVNEIAPRPHNSGHYTIEACAPSQFEMQLRAVCNLPLPEPRLLSPACMANLLGEHCGTGTGLQGSEAAFATPGFGLHLYGKEAARPGRKMGHLTVVAPTVEEALIGATRARNQLVKSYQRSG